MEHLLDTLTTAKSLLCKAALRTNHLELLYSIDRAIRNIEQGINIYKHQAQDPYGPRLNKPNPEEE